jgi:hypothetical protein
MTQRECDDIADDATHAALAIFTKHGLELSSTQIDDLNYAITDLLHEVCNIDPLS